MGGRGAAFEISSTPDGATVKVGDRTCTTPDCALNLPPGRYQLQASKPGYRATVTNVEVKPGGTAPLQVVLAPLPARMLIGTNFSSGTVLLDSRPAGTLRNGELTVDPVQAGDHDVEIRSPDGQASLKFSVAPAQPPQIQTPPQVKDAQVLVISGYAAQTNVRCDCQNGEVSVDGKSVGLLTQGQLAVGTLPVGTHEFRVTAADGTRQAVVALSDDPALNVFLMADRNTGTLIVEAGADDARVFVDNRLQTGRLRQGLLRIPLPVKQYVVRVERKGYVTPPEQRVDLQRGAQQRLTFQLKPQDATLTIRDALAGVKVQIDGQPAGVTANNGSLQASVAPGNHTLEFTRDGYNSKRVTVDFGPGANVNLGRDEVALAEIKVAPPPKPAPDPRAIEAEDWERIRNSTNPDAIDDFLRKHADGAHAEEARAKVAQLRRQQQEEKARQAEQAAWDAVDKTKKAALTDFVSRFGNGAHAQEARGLITGIDSEEAKKQADALAAARAKEQTDRAAADEQAIVRTLKAYEDAYNAMKLDALRSVWTDMPKSTADAINSQFRVARSVTFRLQPNARAVVNGNSATITSARSLGIVTRGGRPAARGFRPRPDYLESCRRRMGDPLNGAVLS